MCRALWPLVFLQKVPCFCPDLIEFSVRISTVSVVVTVFLSFFLNDLNRTANKVLTDNDGNGHG